ncbi:MAG: hypothetical protein J6Z34_00230 [Clostridia bacterium]|nr:hypothetical protein [Clostridia bacterium]
MKLFRKIAIAVLSAAVLVMGTLGLVACNNSGNSGDSSTPDKPTVPSEHIVNGSFENNADESTWTGWTKGGTAFSARGVISGSEVNGVNVDKTGDKFFSGLDGGTQKMTGTLKSDVFEVIGTGKIAFKMGAAKHGDKIYVQFFEENGETALATVTNTDFDGTWITDQLVRKIVDLSEHIGKNIYILVTDEDNNDDYGYVNLDDFVMCLTEDDVATYEEERAAQLVRFGEPTFDEDETSNYIQNPGFETGDLTGWKLMEGTAITNANVLPTTQYYWTDRSVYGNGDYYLDGNDNGGIIESLTGSIRSSKFTLGGDGYIAFKLGSGSGNCYVAICDGETDEELIRQKNTSFSDPKTALMLLRYYVDASRYLGRVLYVKIVDGNSGGGFAFINADDFHVSMTEAEVRALQVADYSAAKNETYTGVTYNDIPTLRDYYENYRYLFPLDALQFTQRAENVILQLSDDAYNLNDYIANVKATVGSTEVTDIAITKVTYGDTVVTTGFNSFVFTDEGSYTVTYTATYNSDVIEETFIVLVRAGSYNVINGDFETGDLTGWTPSDNWGKDDGGKYTGVDSAGTYWAEEAPFNKQGTYFVNGWNNGIEENATWTLRSSTFLLGGSGWITVRMAGNAAAVRVYTEDGTLVGYYKQTRFKDSGFADLTKGSWADMAVYAIDLSAYIGEKLYVELCDENVTSGGWKHAWFDDVNTYYEEIPDWENNYDEVVNGGQAAVSADEKVKVRINWVYAVNAIIANGSFETGDLTGWTPLTEGWTKSEGKYDGVISDQTWWAEQIP